MVECVEHVHTELRIEPIVGPEVVVLGERQIGVGNSRSSNVGNGPGGGADCKLGEGRKHRCIEPFVVGWIADFGALAIPERPFAVADSSQYPSRIPDSGDYNRGSGGPSDDAVSLPSARYTIEHAPAVGKFLPAPEGELVNVACAEYAGNILRPHRPFSARIVLVNSRAADLTDKSDRSGRVVGFLLPGKVGEQTQAVGKVLVDPHSESVVLRFSRGFAEALYAGVLGKLSQQLVGLHRRLAQGRTWKIDNSKERVLDLREQRRAKSEI